MRKIAAVIQAGGLGTRMRSITQDKIPKPMIEMNGKPLLRWQIENIAKYGIKDFVIIIGHLGECIQQYFGNGESIGVNISYISENEPLGSAGALFYLKEYHADTFLLIYGDVMFDMDIDRWLNFHESKDAIITCVCHPNSHPHDSDLVKVDNDNRIVKFLWKKDKREDWYQNLGNAGLFIFEKKVLKLIEAPAKIDWEKNIVDRCVADRTVFAYRTTEYIKDTGTPERFYKAAEEQLAGSWEKRNLSNKQKCVFLDRDGTVNKLAGLVYKTDQLELEDCAAEAIKLLNGAGIMVIICTNQPVVARGMCEISDLETIHNKMETLLGQEGAYLDDIIFCPHHPDKGYPEENPLYKVECDCRKPKTGMLVSMADKYNIDLQESYFVGDTTVDVKTGINANMTTVLVKTGEAGNDGKYDVEADFVVDDLLAAAKLIVNGEVENGLQ